MLRVGLTGGIGGGKSTAIAFLAGLGVRVLDTDSLARDLTRPGTPTLAEITRCFGPEIIEPETGELKRAQLAEVVFRDPRQREILEAILHPPIHSRWVRQLEDWAGAGAAFGVVAIPLLFEKGYQSEFDVVVSAACTTATQLQRLLGRGWTPEQIRLRLESQMSCREKMERSDYVVWTEGILEIHREQWRRLLVRF